MADTGIKIATIKKNDLPPVGVLNNHLVRYRIVSEDKNRSSHWSPVYSVIANDPLDVAGGIDVTANSITAVWGDSDVLSDKEAYDVFAKFDDGAYKYYGTTTSHGFSFLNTGTSSVTVVIQIEGIVKEINNTLKIYESTKALV